MKFFKYIGIMIWVGFLTGAMDPVLAVPGKLYTNVGVVDQNTETITGYILYATSGGVNQYAAISVKDSNSYSPQEVFYNYGHINLGETAATEIDFKGIATPNLNVVLENHAPVDMAFTSVNKSMTLTGMQSFTGMRNYGDITLTPRGGVRTSGGSGHVLAVAYGILSIFDDLDNAGNIVINAQSGTTHVGGNIGSAVIGLYSVGGLLTNSGSITLDAQAGVRTGSGGSGLSSATGIMSSGNVVNSGDIVVRAVAGRSRPNASSPYVSTDAMAIGIQMSATATLHSSGLIQASAELHPGLTGGTRTVNQVRVSSGTTTLTGFAMALGSQADFDASYGGSVEVLSGASLVFSNAVLYLSLSQDFSGREEYEIPMMVQGAAAADQFSSLGPLPTGYTAKLVNGNGASLQKIKFEFAPEVATPLISAQIGNSFNSQGHALMGSHMVNNIIFDLIPSEVVHVSALQETESFMASFNPARSRFPHGPMDDGDYLFVSPLALKSTNDGPKGYGAENHGFMAGTTHDFGGRLFLGPHVGISRADIDYTGPGFESRSEELIAYSLGAHGILHCFESWLVSGMASLFYGEGEYRDTSPLNPETGSYDAWSLRGEISLGHIFQWGGHTVLPEIGGVGVWNHRSAFTTRNLSNPDVTYGAMDETQYYLTAGLRWFGDVEIRPGLYLRPSLGMGISQLVSDGEYHNTMQVGDLKHTLRESEERTQWTPKASIALTTDQFDFLIGYSGSYSGDTRNYLVWVQAGIAL
ncbi:MAG: autotransporter outer membrane beta-barrel domain-containing protein [Desulfobacterales bacterium]|nr:autotransporter outer membrane beta-barrel domain-containing protein [Desulfobacterales bacterium]